MDTSLYRLQCKTKALLTVFTEATRFALGLAVPRAITRGTRGHMMVWGLDCPHSSVTTATGHAHTPTQTPQTTTTHFERLCCLTPDTRPATFLEDDSKQHNRVIARKDQHLPNGDYTSPLQYFYNTIVSSLSFFHDATASSGPGLPHC
jgi:hypothetical protein